MVANHGMTCTEGYLDSGAVRKPWDSQDRWTVFSITALCAQLNATRWKIYFTKLSNCTVFALHIAGYWPITTLNPGTPCIVSAIPCIKYYKSSLYILQFFYSSFCAFIGSSDRAVFLQNTVPYFSVEKHLLAGLISAGGPKSGGPPSKLGCQWFK